MTDTNQILIEAESQLDQMCHLRFDTPAQHRRLTNIVCTISHATRSVDMLQKMITAGMTIVRLNMSHESHEAHEETIRLVREAAAKCSEEQGYICHIGIAMDTKGPEIRTGFIEGNNEVELRKNEILRLSVNKDMMDKGNRECVFVDYVNIINVVDVGHRILINDGTIVLKVKEVAVDCVVCMIEVGGPLGSRKNVSLPKVPADLPACSEKDRFDIKFGIEQDIDFVFPSLIRSAEAIHEIRAILGEKGKHIKIMAKIENLEGLQHLDDILKASDGMLVARADLGIEIPAEKLFLVQKGVIAHCNKAGKPVIAATQFLQSMIFRATPSRAEVADLGNAVLDGADCIMMSSETAIGKFPLETVDACHSICREAETALWYRDLFNDIIAHSPAMIDAAHAVAIATVDAAKKSLATAIVILTTSGKSAQLLSKYRPRCAILAVTRCPRTARHLLVHRGVVPVLFAGSPKTDWLKEIDQRVQYALGIAKKMGITKMGDTVIILSPWKNGGGFTNNMRIVYAFYEHEAYECILRKDSIASAKLAKNSV